MDSKFTIHELIERKDFNELSKREIDMVLSEMTKEEYDTQRLVVVSMMEITVEDHSIFHPSPAIKNAVYQKMEGNSSSTDGILAMFVGLLNRPLPAYSLVIPFVALLFFIPFMWRL